MYEVNFAIPLNKNSLLESSDDYYYVRNVSARMSLKEDLKKAREAFTYDGLECIFQHFDTYYSVLYQGEKIDKQYFVEALKDLLKLGKNLSVTLNSLLKDSEMESEIQVKSLNILKMVVYLFTQISVEYEDKIDREDTKDLKLKKNRRLKSSTSSSADEVDSHFKLQQLKTLNSILHLPIYLLWDPPVCEEQFVNVISEISFCYLQNPEIKQEKENWQEIFSIFGVLIKQYNYSLTLTVRLTQAIKNYEHLESIVPQGIRILVEEYNCVGLIRELVRELTEWQANESLQDAPGAKHCSVILTELTSLMPELMLPEVVYLLQYLLNNSYTLRNCVLSIVTEVILKVLSSENISEEQIQIRNKLLGKLYEHVWDLNAHVRSKTLQNWMKFVSESAVPTNMQIDVLKKACGRIHDKATLVRKNAVQLLIAFLSYNPYTSTLDIDYYEKEILNEVTKFKSYECEIPNIADIVMITEERNAQWAKIEECIRSDLNNLLDSEEDDEDEEQIEKFASQDKRFQFISYLSSGNYKQAFKVSKEFANNDKVYGNDIKSMSVEEQTEFYIMFMKSLFMDINKNTEVLNQVTMDNLAQLAPEKVKEIQKCEENIKYFSDLIVFLKAVDNIIPHVKILLTSATMTDVHSAIEFFVTAYQFNIKNSTEGLAAMLAQMNTTEVDRKKSVVDAYNTLFLSYDGNPKDRPQVVINRLINLLKTVNLCDQPYFCAIIKEWTQSGDIGTAEVEVLWNMFTGRISTSEDDCLAAFCLLKMIAIEKKTTVERNVNLIVEVVLKDKALNNPQFFITACNMLSILGDQQIDVTSTKPCFRISLTDPMWDQLIEILLKIFENEDSHGHACITAITELIYKVCEKPDVISAKLIKDTVYLIKKKSSNANVDIVSCTLLTFLCHLVGEIALKEFIFLDETVYKELKRRNYIRNDKKKNNKNAVNMSKASASVRVQNKSEDMEESYMEGATADDYEAEYILHVCENEIVISNLLSQFSPILSNILKHPHKFDSECLQASTAQALARFMIVSSVFCKEHLQLIMTVLERSKYASVKNNIFVCIADLIYRYPNIIEPWSPHIFAVVKDEDESVRLTAVGILSKLIMEDMLRVKGTISDLALCVADKSTAVVKMTKELFNKLAQKGNALYNVLPDIISRLSNDKEQIDEEIFKELMTFLTGLFEKDKQIESLVGKLCLRFKLTQKVRVWRDVAFCLCLLNYNEKSLERLIDNFGAYKASLEDDVVYDLFIAIVNKYKNSSKDEIKNTVRKLEQLVRSGEIENDDKMLSVSRKKSNPRKKRKSRK